MASIDGQDPARVRTEDEDPSLDFPVEDDQTVWDEEDGLIDSEEVVVEADLADVADQHRDVED
ncbi:hypothetical protein GCM10012320_24310 [Sinomonas cellulolyticus]|uniref:DUF5709 domain-containing protein n=1 Tax=Sinomonas cellulolyticus TaxID=2801916 RepID=A0ABS1JZZ1_9MICC|nr:MULTISPECIES: hypothetical protein [Sinomonas]MBL0704984.1 hypothetical protein [Sinomonas cellulolyticus]GHG53598.1 hypothetical protein GCM10012320_24310 [Sinomonas sp. KCTC 49339]